MNAYEITSKHYSEIYVKAQEIIDRHTPCKITKHGNGEVSCLSYKEPGHICCIGCEYLGLNGCRVKCLGCKMNLCSYIKFHTKSPATKELDTLRAKILYPGYLLRIRTNKEDAMRTVRRYKLCKFNKTILCVRHADINMVGWPCNSSIYAWRCDHDKSS